MKKQWTLHLNETVVFNKLKNMLLLLVLVVGFAGAQQTIVESVDDYRGSQHGDSWISIHFDERVTHGMPAFLERISWCRSVVTNEAPPFDIDQCRAHNLQRVQLYPNARINMRQPLDEPNTIYIDPKDLGGWDAERQMDIIVEARVDRHTLLRQVVRFNRPSVFATHPPVPTVPPPPAPTARPTSPTPTQTPAPTTTEQVILVTVPPPTVPPTVAETSTTQTTTKMPKTSSTTPSTTASTTTEPAIDSSLDSKIATDKDPFVDILNSEYQPQHPWMASLILFGSGMVALLVLVVGVKVWRRRNAAQRRLQQNRSDLNQRLHGGGSNNGYNWSNAPIDDEEEEDVTAPAMDNGSGWVQQLLVQWAGGRNSTFAQNLGL